MIWVVLASYLDEFHGASQALFRKWCIKAEVGLSFFPSNVKSFNFVQKPDAIQG